MIKEYKELLLKDLCARLYYGVKADGYPWITSEYVKGITKESVNLQGTWINIENVKPYLRSMSNMTEEEEKEFSRISGFVVFGDYFDNEVSVNDLAYIDTDCFNNTLDFLLRNHIDFRGLIEKGLAFEATENMYKSK